MGAADDANKELTDAKSTGGRSERMRALLEAAFAPDALDIIDESAAHAGHAGAAPGGETHFRIRLSSKALTGLPRVERQRRVMVALQTEFASGLHALSLDIV